MRVFISYCREDKRVADEVYLGLRDRDFLPWMDEPPEPYHLEGIRPGEHWKIRIEEHLGQSDLAIVLVSSMRYLKKRRYFNNEMKLISDIRDSMAGTEIFLVPVVLDEALNINEVRFGRSNLADIHYVRYYAGGVGLLLSGLEALRESIQNPFSESPFETNDGTWRSKELSEEGWAILFPESAGPGTRDALKPLMDHRRNQVGPLFREFEYKMGESVQQFLGRNGAGAGVVNRAMIPANILIVGDPGWTGDPTLIPYDFQIDLGIQFSVGRLALEKDEDFSVYASKLVSYERALPREPLKLGLFAPVHQGDIVSKIVLENLANPLKLGISARIGPEKVDEVFGSVATKERLTRMISNAQGVIVSMSHGVSGQSRQTSSILCADWEGVGTPLCDQDLFSEGDVCSLTKRGERDGINGSVFVMFEAYGCGGLQTKSSAPYVSALSNSLLACPGISTLAVVGRLSEGSTCTFDWFGRGGDVWTYVMLVDSLMTGAKVGESLSFLRERQKVLAGQIASLTDSQLLRLAYPSGTELLRLWDVYRDARGFVLLGDPATRLMR